MTLKKQTEKEIRRSISFAKKKDYNFLRLDFEIHDSIHDKLSDEDYRIDVYKGKTIIRWDD